MLFRHLFLLYKFPTQKTRLRQFIKAYQIIFWNLFELIIRHMKNRK